MMHADYTLEQGEWKRIEDPEIISSGGLDPCIAVGMYDRNNKYGYMLHVANVFHHDILEKFLKDVLSNSNKKYLEIYVTGGRIDKTSRQDIQDDLETCRDYVSDKLSEIFNSQQITYNWNDSHLGVDLYLDANSGKFHLMTQDRSEDWSFPEEESGDEW